MIEMDMAGVRVELPSNQPIVLLKERTGERYLPIWIGAAEAAAIALSLQGVVTPRPMTHDLMKNILEDLDAQVERIVVSGLKDNTFYAVIHVSSGTVTRAIDARPSDAIALALRTKSPIYVEESVIRDAKSLEQSKESLDTSRLQKWLEDLSDEELGKYKM